MLPPHPPARAELRGQQAALKHASELGRTYATLLEALNRRRGKGDVCAQCSMNVLAIIYKGR